MTMERPSGTTDADQELMDFFYARFQAWTDGFLNDYDEDAVEQALRQAAFSATVVLKIRGKKMTVSERASMS